MILSSNFDETVSSFDKTFHTNESFDLIKRELIVKNGRAVLYYIDGFVKGSDLQKMLIFLVDLDNFGDGQKGAAERFRAEHLPDVEVSVTQNEEEIIRSVQSGCCVMVSDGFNGDAIIIDLRSYPARDVSDNENDRVMRGARDGFVETLIFNTALIRRRIRDTSLIMKYVSVGERSKTDVVIAYIEGVADKNYVEKIIHELESLKTDALPLGHQSLEECLCRHGWWNPLPKVRLTARPDAPAAHILEGGVAVLCDTSPEAMLLPTSFFDFMQETNDYYFPPVTGSYLRIMRLVVFISTIFITPVWYLILRYEDLIPGCLRFLIPENRGAIPVIIQLFLTEFALDALKLASLTTPSAMSNSLSIIGGLLIGDYAVQAGWLIPEVIFYMAFTSIANFVQSNYELGYTFKFYRLFLLLLSALFGIWGFAGGVIAIIIMPALTHTVGGAPYLYPIIPWNGKALSRLLLRRKKQSKGS
ncbi:MAG: spore germination protein [Firmicutes bacterium]|nr:spore germination protein [Bacillota bacterium]